MPTLDWIGKQAVVHHHKEVPYRLLHCDSKLSVGDPDSGNLLVQGDNLEALKALLPYYRGQIKCIYIDPPYNTGNEGWQYNDNVNSPEIRQWLRKTVGKEGEDLSRHDKWLCMMYPRLSLLREFLTKESGVLIVHIDEHENSSLVILLDELFGRNNKLGEVIWDKRNPKGDAETISYQHESIIWYAKDKSAFSNNFSIKLKKNNAERIIRKASQFFKLVDKEVLPKSLSLALSTISHDEIIQGEFPDALDALSSIDSKRLKRKYKLADAQQDFSNWMNKQVGLLEGEKPYKHMTDSGRAFRLASMAWPNSKKAPAEYFKPLKHPITGQECPVPSKGWRNPPTTMEKLLNDGLIKFGADHKKQPERVYFLDEQLQTNFSSVIYFGGSDSKFYKDLQIEFENPKPVDLARLILESCTQHDDIIMDSFSGTGTVGHAILQLNKHDGGNRKFILCEMDKDIARKVTAKRLHSVINGYNKRGDPQKPIAGLGGGFRYCHLGTELFNEFGDIHPEVAFPDLAAHIFFSETGSPLPKRVDGSTPFIGQYQNRLIYLLFSAANQGFVREVADNVLTPDRLKALPQPPDGFTGQRVVYAEGCIVTSERLAEHGVVFKQIPYQVEGV